MMKQRRTTRQKQRVATETAETCYLLDLKNRAIRNH